MEQQPRSHNFAPLVPTPLPSSLQTAGASGWYNLTAWAVNVTRYAPFLEEL
ncbi:Protein ASI3, partial [Tolypocladium capitatum]